MCVCVCLCSSFVSNDLRCIAILVSFIFLSFHCVVLVIVSFIFRFSVFFLSLARSSGTEWHIHRVPSHKYIHYVYLWCSGDCQTIDHRMWTEITPYWLCHRCRSLVAAAWSPNISSIPFHFIYRSVKWSIAIRIDDDHRWHCRPNITTTVSTQNLFIQISFP